MGTGTALRGQHPLPVSAQGQIVGDDHGARSAHDDRQLVDGHQASADARRRHFGDEHGRDHRGQPNADPAHEAEETEDEDGRNGRGCANPEFAMVENADPPSDQAGDGCSHGAHREKQAGEDKCSFPAPAIAERAAYQRAGHATQQRAAHGWPTSSGVRPKSGRMKTIAPEMIDRS